MNQGDILILLRVRLYLFQWALLESIRMIIQTFCIFVYIVQRKIEKAKEIKSNGCPLYTLSLFGHSAYFGGVFSQAQYMLKPLISTELD